MAVIVEKVDRCATIRDGPLNASQINRISRQAGTAESIKAFTKAEEAYDFVNGAG